MATQIRMVVKSIQNPNIRSQLDKWRSMHLKKIGGNKNSKKGLNTKEDREQNVITVEALEAEMIEAKEKGIDQINIWVKLSKEEEGHLPEMLSENMNFGVPTIVVDKYQAESLRCVWRGSNGKFTVYEFKQPETGQQVVKGNLKIVTIKWMSSAETKAEIRFHNAQKIVMKKFCQKSTTVKYRIESY